MEVERIGYDIQLPEVVPGDRFEVLYIEHVIGPCGWTEACRVTFKSLRPAKAYARKLKKISKTSRDRSSKSNVQYTDISLWLINTVEYDF